MTLMYQMITMKTFREIIVVLPVTIFLSSFLKREENLYIDKECTDNSIFSINTDYNLSDAVSD